MSKKVGIDIGGTFTDVIVMDEITGEIEADKVLSTPKDPASAVIEYIRKNVPSLDKVSLLVHGTTVATNAVVEIKGAKLGLVTTEGQRDRLDIQRTNWLRMYDVTYQKPEPLIPKVLRREVKGRTLYDGTILTPLDTDELIEKTRELVEFNGVEGICVCFLNSYVNPAQEQEAKATIKKHFPEVYVVTSSETLAEVLEYERFSTAVISAFLMPEMDRYLGRLEDFLKEKGFLRQRFMIMQGNGGMVNSSFAREMAACTVESGPAGGVIGSQYLTGMKGIQDIITLDMGGTTTDVCLIRKGQPYVTLDYKVAGHPMRFPLLDIYSIGAGGGSIAWVDEGGGLHVGPQSAGANPGPACYGLGGDEPTISDAHVLLGRLIPNTSLGGKIGVRHDLAEKALSKIATYYKISPKEAAITIIKIANENMLNALRVISVEKGIAPHLYTLVAYGGAGPMHGGALMKRLKMQRYIVPLLPGCHSALGLVTSDIKHDYVRSILQPTSKVDIDFVHEIYKSLETKAMSVLRAEGVQDKDIIIEHQCDIRYVGQAYVPVIIPFSWHSPKEKQLADTEAIFRKVHQELYKHAGEQATEIISLRIHAIGKEEKPTLDLRIKSGKTSPSPTKRNVYFEDIDRFIECDTYNRDDLPADFSFEGPSVIYQMDTTSLVYSGQKATIDRYGNMVIEGQDV